MLQSSCSRCYAESLMTTHRWHFLPKFSSHGYLHPCMEAGRQRSSQKNAPCLLRPVERGLDGFDYRQLKRLGDVTKTVPANMGIDKAALEHEQQSNEGSRSGSETRDWNNLEAGSVTQQPWGRSRFSPTATLRRTEVGGLTKVRANHYEALFGLNIRHFPAKGLKFGVTHFVPIGVNRP